MDKILMRHDDVNTFGVVLYANSTVGARLYKDAELTQPVSLEEGRDLLLKTAYIGVIEEDSGGFKVYGKPSSIVFGEFEHVVAYQYTFAGGGSGSGMLYDTVAVVFNGEPEVNLPN